MSTTLVAGGIVVVGAGSVAEGAAVEPSDGIEVVDGVPGGVATSLPELPVHAARTNAMTKKMGTRSRVSLGTVAQ